MIEVPFIDLKAAHAELESQIAASVVRVIESGWYIGGREVAAFEEAFGDYCGASHCVGAGNGLDALHLALAAMEVGPGDEVILASNSFIATLLAVSRVGATPVLVEPDSKTFNLDPARIEAAISPRTKVLLPTHLYGQPADLDPILALARKHGLKVLEDAAQAHGARYKGQRIGSHGDAIAWSFYPTKNLGALGDGGALTTNDAELARRVRQLGNYGFGERYVANVKGVNSRLDPLQAAILAAKLPYLDQWNQRRRAVADRYSDALADCGLVQTPYVPSWAEPLWHLYVIQTPDRDRLQSQLTHRGVQSLIHYPVPPHLQRAYRDLGQAPGAFPIAEGLAETVLSLPINPHMDELAVEAVIEAVRSASAE